MCDFFNLLSSFRNFFKIVEDIAEIVSSFSKEKILDGIADIVPTPRAFS